MHFTTVQEACDYAVKKIVEQGKQCANADGNCIYDDTQGNHCAIGWLLSDELLILSSDISGGVRVLISEFGDYVPIMIRENVELFNTLQKFHDSDSKTYRKRIQEQLNEDHAIDTSAPHWQQWIDMATNLYL